MLHSLIHQMNRPSGDCTLPVNCEELPEKNTKICLNSGVFQLVQAMFGGENWLLRKVCLHVSLIFAVILRGQHWMERLLLPLKLPWGKFLQLPVGQWSFLGYYILLISALQVSLSQCCWFLPKSCERKGLIDLVFSSLTEK